MTRSFGTTDIKDLLERLPLRYGQLEKFQIVWYTCVCLRCNVVRFVFAELY